LRPYLFYFANPKHGGWVSFTAHLAHALGIKTIYKIGAKYEPKLRPFGWDIYYQNVNMDYLFATNNIVITAFEKSHYPLLPVLNRLLEHGKRITIITHDTIEFKQEILKWLREHYDVVTLISIRQNIKDYLAFNYSIESKFILHPFFQFTKEIDGNGKIENSVAISRVDFDKHTEFLIKANQELSVENRIKIYGKTNRIYEFQILNKLLPENQIPFSKNYPDYHGVLDLTFHGLSKILSHAKYSVDMSAIKGDGGGTQYTFLESIYHNVPLILNHKWMTDVQSDTFKDGKNCFMASDEVDLQYIINEVSDRDRNKIRINAGKILQEHYQANDVWLKELKLN
jgi:hypothetical protein